jgi:hypothetical protein
MSPVASSSTMMNLRIIMSSLSIFKAGILATVPGALPLYGLGAFIIWITGNHNG